MTDNDDFPVDAKKFCFIPGFYPLINDINISQNNTGQFGQRIMNSNKLS